jgi:hypothetical protein
MGILLTVHLRHLSSLLPILLLVAFVDEIQEVLHVHRRSIQKPQNIACADPAILVFSQARLGDLVAEEVAGGVCVCLSTYHDMHVT